MIKPDLLYNFISPVSGRVLCDFNYVLVGNRYNIATPSPILIDIRLDLIKIRQDINAIMAADFVIGHPAPILKKAQVLSLLDDGFMYNTKGVVSTKPSIPPGVLDLTYGHIFIGDSSNKAKDTAFPNKQLLTGDVNNRAVFRTVLPIDNMANLSNGKIWVGSGNRPTEIDLPSGGGGAPIDATYVLITPNNKLSNATDLRSLILESLPPKPTGGILWTRGILDLNPLPPGTIGALRLAKGGSGITDDYVDPISFSLAIDELQLQIDAIEEELLIIDALIVVIQGQIIDLYNKAKRPLNKIADDNPTSGDVNINNWKLVNVADPINPLDAVNLRTLVNRVPGTVITLSNTYYVDSIRGNDANTGSILSPFRTIQKAIDATPTLSASCYAIYISNGSYTENLTITNKKVTFVTAGNENSLNNVFITGFHTINFTTNNLYFFTVLFEGIVFYAPSAGTVLSLIGMQYSIQLTNCKFNSNPAVSGVRFINQTAPVNLYIANCKFVGAGANFGVGITTSAGLLDIFNTLFEQTSSTYMILSTGSNRLIVKSSFFSSLNTDTIPEKAMISVDNSLVLNNLINNCYFYGSTFSADNQAAISVTNNLNGLLVTSCTFSVRTAGADCILRPNGIGITFIQINSSYALQGTAFGVPDITQAALLGRAVGNCGNITLTGDVTGNGSIPGIVSTSFNLSLDQIAQQNLNTDDVTMSEKRLIDLGEPVDNSDAVTKYYVDSRIIPVLPRARFISYFNSQDLRLSFPARTIEPILFRIDDFNSLQIDNQLDFVRTSRFVGATYRGNKAEGASSVIRAVLTIRAVGYGEIILAMTSAPNNDPANCLNPQNGQFIEVQRGGYFILTMESYVNFYFNQHVHLLVGAKNVGGSAVFNLYLEQCTFYIQEI